jgi:hypothetical protein
MEGGRDQRFFVWEDGPQIQQDSSFFHAGNDRRIRGAEACSKFIRADAVPTQG